MSYFFVQIQGRFMYFITFLRFFFYFFVIQIRVKIMFFDHFPMYFFCFIFNDALLGSRRLMVVSFFFERVFLLYIVTVGTLTNVIPTKVGVAHFNKGSHLVIPTICVGKREFWDLLSIIIGLNMINVNMTLIYATLDTLVYTKDALHTLNDLDDLVGLL